MKGKERNHFSLSISFNPQVPRRWEEGPGGWGAGGALIKDFSLLLSISLSSFEQTRRKNLSENR